jgi:oligosaccharyltransferase complex subunit delta (ribophorin II)
MMACHGSGILIATLAVVYIAAIGAQLSTYVSPADLAAFISRARDELSHPRSLKDSYYAVRLLRSLNEEVKTCDCESLGSLYGSLRSRLLDTHYGYAVYSACKCGVLPASSSAQIRDITNDLSSQDLPTFSAAVLAARALGITYDIHEIIEKMKQLIGPDRMFSQTAALDTHSSSIDNTKMAMAMLVEIASEPAVQRMSNVLSESIDMHIPAGSDEMAVDATLLAYASTFSVKKPRLNSSRFTRIVDGLINGLSIGDMELLALTFESLQYLASYKAHPIFVHLKNDKYIAGKDGQSVEFELLHFLGGKPLTNVKAVNVTSSSLIDKGSRASVSLYSGALNPSDMRFVIPVDNFKMGRYVLTMKVQIANRTNPLTLEQTFVAQGSASVSAVYVGVSKEPKTDYTNLTKVKKQNGLADTIAYAVDGDYLNIIFSVKLEPIDAIHLQQVVLRLTHLDSGRSVVYTIVGKIGKSSAKYAISISLGAELDNFAYQSGMYTASLLVGDEALMSPIEWIVGSIRLEFPERVRNIEPLYKKALLHDSDITMKALPEIEHVLRPPADRPSPFLAMMFTAMIAVNLVVFLAFIVTRGPNVKLLRTLPSFGFLACIGAMLVLYMGYWLALPGFTFYDTIKYICILAPITITVGGAALPSIAMLRITRQQKQSR